MNNTTHTFDGTTYTIAHSADGFEVSVTEADKTLTLVTVDGSDLYRNAIINSEAMKRAGVDAWICDRISFCFSLACYKIFRIAYGS